MPVCLSWWTLLLPVTPSPPTHVIGHTQSLTLHYPGQHAYNHQPTFFYSGTQLLINNLWSQIYMWSQSTQLHLSKPCLHLLQVPICHTYTFSLPISLCPLIMPYCPVCTIIQPLLILTSQNILVSSYSAQ